MPVISSSGQLGSPLSQELSQVRAELRPGSLDLAPGQRDARAGVGLQWEEGPKTSEEAPRGELKSLRLGEGSPRGDDEGAAPTLSHTEPALMKLWPADAADAGGQDRVMSRGSVDRCAVQPLGLAEGAELQRLRLALAASALAWLLGVSLPMVTVQPFPFLVQGMPQHAGYEAAMRPLRKSTLGAILALWRHGHHLALVILALCSVVVPAAKLAAGLLALLPAGRLRTLPKALTGGAPWALAVLVKVGTYQMVDLLLCLLLVAHLHGEVFDSRLEPGFLFFAVYCGLSQWLLRRLHAHYPEAAGGPQVDEKPGQKVVLEADLCSASLTAAVLIGAVAHASSQPMLEVAIIFEDFCVGRTRLGLLSVAGALLPQAGYLGGAILAMAFLGSAVLGPPLVASLVAAGAWLGRGRKGAPLPEDPGQRLLRLARRLSGWVLPEVFCLALLTFLFTVQEENVRTLVARGSLLGRSSELCSGYHCYYYYY